MPSIKQIEKTMQKQGIPQEILSQFDFTYEKGNRPEPFISLMDKMDELLTKEQCLSIMEQEGCCKGGQLEKDCKEFGKKYADKSLAEKLALLPNVHEYMMNPVLNENNTITVTFGGHQNGVHTGKTTCSCGTITKLKQPFSVSPTYCGCCAGHFLHHYQNALGVKLRLEEINSSPLNTDGEKPCQFTFEILDK